MKKVKCNECGYVGDECKFPHDLDFFQKSFVSSCPQCTNSQSPGDASMRMFNRDRPFSYVDETISDNSITETMLRSNQAS